VREWTDTGIDTRGHTSGEIKTTCPRCSAQRKKKTYPCLNVNLDKGVWNCWHCGWSGSLHEGEYQRPTTVRKAYRKPDYDRKASPSGPGDLVAAWFQKRGITPAVLRRNQITVGTAYFPQVEEERAAVQFPYLRGGEVVNVKYRTTTEKLFRMESGCERILYGLDDVKAGERLVWVEGEMDKLAIEVAGQTACVSVPDGAPAVDARSYETKFDFMDAPEIERASVHLIAVDNDPPGLRLRDELVRRLGPERCRIVDWPDGCKDANDVLMQMGVDIVLACLNDARELPIVGAHQVTDVMDDIQRIYREGVPRGVSTGWPNLDRLYRVRTGDVCVITGTPNSGKSEWLDALMVQLAQRESWRFGVYSPEQGSQAEHIAKLVEKHAGRPFRSGPDMEQISPEVLDRALTWLNDRFIWMGPDEPTLDAILAVAKQLVRRRGCRGIIMDPWNEIEHSRPEAMSETEYIGNSLRMVRHFARDHDVAFFIVAHPAKLQRDKDTKKYPVPTPYDISGSAHWHNKPDVCISLYRDKQRDEGEVEVHVQKVRSKYVGRLGFTSLAWDRVTGRYADPQAAERYRNKGEIE
jgi:twinkle protein